MADIKVSGRIKIASFQKEFLKSFPYLNPTFRDNKGISIPNDNTIAKATVLANGGEYKPTKVVEDFSIVGNLLVGTFEKRMKDTFGLNVEVCVQKSGRMYKTGDKYDKLSLTKANELAKSEGSEPIKI